MTTKEKSYCNMNEESMEKRIYTAEDTRKIKSDREETFEENFIGKKTIDKEKRSVL